MASMKTTTCSTSGLTSRPFSAVRTALTSHRTVLASPPCASPQDDAITRREIISGAVFSALFASAMVNPAPPAYAFGGIDPDTVVAAYTEDTQRVLALTKDALALTKEDPQRTEKMTELRKEIATWVSAYRRKDAVSGRPSFGATYSALNALAGQFTSFGVDAPVPKKRLDRLTKEINDAGVFLSKGR